MSDDFFKETCVKARKKYTCCECLRTIEPGTRYFKSTGHQDGEFYYFKTCLDCSDLRKEIGGLLGCGIDICFSELSEVIEECIDKDHPIYGRAIYLGVIRHPGFRYG
jgi:hypothetical protein